MSSPSFAGRHAEYDELESATGRQDRRYFILSLSNYIFTTQDIERLFRKHYLDSTSDIWSDYELITIYGWVSLPVWAHACMYTHSDWLSYWSVFSLWTTKFFTCSSSVYMCGLLCFRGCKSLSKSLLIQRNWRTSSWHKLLSADLIWGYFLACWKSP